MRKPDSCEHENTFARPAGLLAGRVFTTELVAAADSALKRRGQRYLPFELAFAAAPNDPLRSKLSCVLSA